MRIYWANSFFSEADRRFNEECVRALREHGHEIFAPQNTGENNALEVTAEGIFASDTAAIRGSALVIACIDQETIDCGVACEIGYACALGIPVVAFITDLRWKRTGAGRIYKNPFVIGAISKVGVLLESFQAVLQHLNAYHHDDK